jgi:hypothetical protein
MLIAEFASLARSAPTKNAMISFAKGVSIRSHFVPGGTFYSDRDESFLGVGVAMANAYTRIA